MASKNWALLDSLRARFLASIPGTDQTDYWDSTEHLAAYDETFAERIGWKWRAVLSELKGSGFTPPAGYALHDFGTGTGIAPRTFFAHFPAAGAASVGLADRSERAVQFARDRLAKAHPGVRADAWNPERGLAAQPAVLLVSHVLTEMADPARKALIELALKAHTVIWVEPGTPAASRALLEAREALRGTGAYRLLAPCPHQNACGMLTPENARHWCHMFAKPPSEASMSAYWSEFGKRMGIDLRALPVSYLVATRDRAAAQAVPATDARVIGRAREYKGFLKILACDDAGVREATVQKRASKARYKEVAEGAFTTHLPKTEAPP